MWYIYTKVKEGLISKYFNIFLNPSPVTKYWILSPIYIFLLSNIQENRICNQTATIWIIRRWVIIIFPPHTIYTLYSKCQGFQERTTSRSVSLQIAQHFIFFPNRTQLYTTLIKLIQPYLLLVKN